MLIDSLAIIVGLILLIWSADRFIVGAASTARNFDVPPLIIGLTIVGFGTSAPEMMVAGFAGGLGLSGNACGALSASIWMKNLERCKENEKTSYKDPNSEATLETFYKETDYEMRCDKIIGKSFESLDDHTAYIKNGGCEKLINTLSKIQ